LGEKSLNAFYIATTTTAAAAAAEATACKKSNFKDIKA
jgi:hypothetical protein